MHFIFAIFQVKSKSLQLHVQCISQNFDRRFAKFYCKSHKSASNLGISLRNWQSNGKLSNEPGNFMSNIVGMWQTNFTIGLGCCFERSAKERQFQVFCQKLLKATIPAKSSWDTWAISHIPLPPKSMLENIAFFPSKGQKSPDYQH